MSLTFLLQLDTPPQLAPLEEWIKKADWTKILSA